MSEQVSSDDNQISVAEGWVCPQVWYVEVRICPGEVDPYNATYPKMMPPLTNEQRDICRNITLPQWPLRTVKIHRHFCCFEIPCYSVDNQYQNTYHNYQNNEEQQSTAQNSRPSEFSSCS